MTTAASAHDTADRYFSAQQHKDFGAMRALLHDDVTFVGPLGTTHGADEYIDAMHMVMANATGMERHALFTEGENVCQIYDLTLSQPNTTLKIASWLTVRDGRIAAVRIYFDARPFAG